MNSNTKRKIAEDYTLIATCYHEASHAISALLVCSRVNYIDVIPKKESYGEISVDDIIYFYGKKSFSKELTLKVIKNRINMFYAGLIGETIYYKSICGSKKLPIYFKKSSSDDLSEITKLFNSNSIVKAGKERFEYKKLIEKNVENTLMKYWEDIKLLAIYAYKYKKINYKKIKKLLMNNSKNKNIWIDKFSKIEKLYSDKIILKASKIEAILFSDTLFNSSF